MIRKCRMFFLVAMGVLFSGSILCHASLGEVKTDKEVYQGGETIKVTYSGASGLDSDWICIVPAASPETDAGNYKYLLRGSNVGTLTFDPPVPGKYEVRAYYNYHKVGYVVAARAAFSVTGDTGNIKEAGRKESVPNESSEQSLQIQQLTKKYTKVVFQGFTADSQTMTDYPTAVSECESSAISSILSKKIFDYVEKEKDGARYNNALLVKGTVVNMRIVSFGARFWIGAMAGSSDMSVKLTFRDADSGTVVNEKLISSANNPFGAAWTLGSNDRSLPEDMGRIIGEYIAAINPAK